MPFTCVYWKTKKTEIEKLLKWANSSARMCGRDGHAPDMTGCTAQALLACSHNFDMTPTLHASSQLTAYQGYCAGFPSEQCGPAGTLDFAVNPQILLRAMDPPPFPEFEYVEIETSPFPPGKYQIHSIKQPVSTGVRLFKQFIQLLINNGLLPPNGKFILNQRWAQSDGEPWK